MFSPTQAGRAKTLQEKEEGPAKLPVPSIPSVQVPHPPQRARWTKSWGREVSIKIATGMSQVMFVSAEHRLFFKVVWGKL